MIKKRITIEFIDKAGEFRVNQKSSNGNITHASTEGYKNRSDMRENEIESAIGILDFYAEWLTHPQFQKLNCIARKEFVNPFVNPIDKRKIK